MKKLFKKLLYTKCLYFKGREYSKWIKVDGMETPHCVFLRNVYTIEFEFMPYTWGLGFDITFRKDYKSISITILPFGMAIMVEDEVSR